MGEQRRINLGEGILPHGTGEREVVVSTLLLVVRDALRPETHDEAMSWLETREGEITCSWIGIPAAALRERLVEILDDPELLVAFICHLTRPSAPQIYDDLMAA